SLLLDEWAVGELWPHLQGCTQSSSAIGVAQVLWSQSKRITTKPMPLTCPSRIIWTVTTANSLAYGLAAGAKKVSLFSLPSPASMLHSGLAAPSPEARLSALRFGTSASF